MLLGTLSAPKRGHVGSKPLNAVRGTPTFGSLFDKKLRFKGAEGSSWDLKWFPNRVFEARLALVSSKNEVKITYNACNLAPKSAFKCYLGPFRHQNAARWAPRRSTQFGVPRPLGPFGWKMSLQGRIMAPIWDLKWRPKRGFETKLALGSSKNEVLGAAFET